MIFCWVDFSPKWTTHCFSDPHWSLCLYLWCGILCTLYILAFSIVFGWRCSSRICCILMKEYLGIAVSRRWPSVKACAISLLMRHRSIAHQKLFFWYHYSSVDIFSSTNDLWRRLALLLCQLVHYSQKWTTHHHFMIHSLELVSITPTCSCIPLIR